LNAQLDAKPALASCRFCEQDLYDTVVDLGMSPLCESYVSATELNQMEPFFPLRVYVCRSCFLVQLEQYVSSDEIFTEYAYFSSFSDSWLEHARIYTDQIIEALRLDQTSKVLEIASNDGYLLRNFVDRGIPALGIEPAANVAKAAKEIGVPTLVKFFGQETARDLIEEHGQFDLVIGNNVLAQVPDLNDFVAGMQIVLAPDGVITMEFPHLMRLMEENQFDTIYHEHFSYFSLLSTEKIFSAHELTVFDVELLPTHGGSLRIYARHAADDSKPVTDGIKRLRARELKDGFDHIERYLSFGQQVKETKRKLLRFLIQARDEGRAVVGYGAPGKGNTLLNYCGIRTDLLDYTVDRNPYKQGKYLPGTHVPVFAPDRIRETKPDYVLILPWNFKDEIMHQMADIRDWGGRFVVPIPQVEVIP
jgi:SAM-dependent methyltransferase